MDVVNIEKLSKTYQMGTFELHALRDVDLKIEQGKYMAIMGPSGSGKSTLLNLLGCLDRPTSGNYWLSDKDVSELISITPTKEVIIGCQVNGSSAV